MMDEWPPLAILLLTYQRTEEAVKTLEGISKNLGYNVRAFYIADDGSTGEHVNVLLKTLEDLGEQVIGHHSHRFSPYTGRGWNKGLGICYQHSDYVLVLEDDWVLDRPFDLFPFIEMLSERQDVGLVRLGHLAVGNMVEIVGHNGVHYLKYQRDRQYAYSGNPQIRHARWTQTYGWYSEDKLNPGELELDLDGRFRNQTGPDIWRPSDIPGWGIFKHIGAKRYR